jgi:DNA-binding LacI/PurR family transcriptional regulator/DNA-binding CsgD family transcriptional regulator
MPGQVNVLIDNYADMVLYSWTSLRGINETAYQKKMGVRTFFSVDDLVKTLAKESRRYVIVISESKNHSETLLSVLNRQEIYPIFINQQFEDTSYSFSSVIPKLYSSYYKLARAVLKESAEPSAFVAFNKDSIPDKFGLEAIRKAAAEQGVKEYLFPYDGDMDQCIGNAMRELPRYKNIFCTNDMVAVLLMKKMKEEGVNPADYNITGSNNTKIGECFKPSLTTVGENHYNAGIIAVEVLVLLFKQKLVHNLYVNMESEIIFRESTRLKIKKAEDIPVPWNSGEPVVEMVDFFGDELINKIRIIERMLINCDERDFSILRGLLSNKTYEEIAEDHEMAVNTIKYRLKKIENRLKVSSRSEVFACLNAYDLNI